MNPPPPIVDAPRPPSRRRLTRDPDDRILGGVASGLAHTYGYDVALVRIAFALVAVATFGTALCGYLVAWMVIPESDGSTIANDFKTRGTRRHRSRRSVWIAIAMFVVGANALSDKWGSVWSRVFGPIVLIGVGLAVLLSRRDPEFPADFPRDADPLFDGGEEPSPASSTQTPAAPPDRLSSEPQSVRAWPVGPYRQSNIDDRQPVSLRRSARDLRRRHRREPSPLAGITLSALCAMGGLLWLLDTAGTFSPNPGIVLPIALGVIGVALVIGAWFGHARRLVFLALPLTFICAVSAVLNGPMRGGVGELVIHPTTTGEMGRGYERSAGHFVIDLTGVSGTHAISLSARLGIGQLEIVVPQDADVIVEARIGAGDLALFGELNDGGYHQHKTRLSPGSGRHIQITAKLGIGEVLVRRESGPISIEGSTTTAVLGTDGQTNTPTSEPPTPTTSARVSSPDVTATAASVTSVTAGSIRHTWEMQR